MITAPNQDQVSRTSANRIKPIVAAIGKRRKSNGMTALASAFLKDRGQQLEGCDSGIVAFHVTSPNGADPSDKDRIQVQGPVAPASLRRRRRRDVPAPLQRLGYVAKSLACALGFRYTSLHLRLILILDLLAIDSFNANCLRGRWHCSIL